MLINIPTIKIAFLVNIIAPYRIPIYQFLAESFKLAIFISGKEKNRNKWIGIEKELKDIYVKKAWGFTLTFSQKGKSGFFDFRHIHINPGYFVDLIKFSPDVVISNELGFRSLVALIYCKLLKRHLWIWWGGTLHTERSIGPIKILWRKILIKFVPRWISYGETSTEYLLHLGVNREKILQIQNCIDEVTFMKPTLPLFDLRPKPVLMYVGQFIERKGIDLLIESAFRLQKKGFKFTLALIGDGPEKIRIIEKANKLGIENIYFFPSQPPSLMPRVYKSADALILPSLEDVWGLVVNEAIWSGIPVAASIYAGCTKEIVPVENRFDPLNNEDFDNILIKAIKGNLSKRYPSLLTCKKVSQMIKDDIINVLLKHRIKN